jgi:hypothetical protein
MFWAVINFMVEAEIKGLLGKLPQIIQHLRCQFAPSVGSHVHLDNCIEQLMDLLEHLYAHIFVPLDCLVRVGQFPWRINVQELPVPSSKATT